MFGEGRQTKAGNGNGAIKRLQRRRSRPSPNSTHRPSPATCSVRRMRAPRPSPDTCTPLHPSPHLPLAPLPRMRQTADRFSDKRQSSSCCKYNYRPACYTRGGFSWCAKRAIALLLLIRGAAQGELLDALNQLLPGMHIIFLINSVHMGFHSMIGHHKRFFNLRG